MIGQIGCVQILDLNFGPSHLTDEPGLGVELDEEAMRKCWPEFSL
jgi:L-alanine-DL-glutamate epimerase-like enolase superfamily enzyme